MELLISIGFAGLLASLSLSAVVSARRLSTTAEKSFERNSAITTTRFFIERALLASDTHRLAIPPVVHENGWIETGTSTPHPLMSLRTPSRPKLSSDAITAVRVYPGVALEVQDPLVGNELSDTLACSTLAVPDADVTEFVGISKLGMTILTGSSKREGSTCLRVTASPSTLYAIANGDGEPAKMLTLLPVDSLFAVYVDTRNTLRYVSFNDTNLLENQPVVEGIDSLQLQINADKDGAGEYYMLSGRMKLVDGYGSLFRLYGRLGRRAYWNTLLWSY